MVLMAVLFWPRSRADRHYLYKKQFKLLELILFFSALPKKIEALVNLA